MTPLFPAARAAEEFDQALGGTATPAVTERYAQLLDTVVALRSQPEVMPRAEFAGDLRSRLMTAAETDLVAAPSVVRRLPPTRTPQRNRRVGTIAASLVIVGGSAGMAAAASSSLPGEGLYPIKRGVEQASTAVRIGDAAKGRTQLDHAAARLDEVRDLQALGSPDAQLIATTIDSFSNAADSGSAKLFAAYAASGDDADITAVRDFTAAQMAQINDLSGTSATTDEALLDAADTLAAIDQQARQLCETCGPKAPLTLPGQLSAGAGAATVDNLLARPVSQAEVDITATEAAAIERLKGTAEKTAQELADDLKKGLDANGLPTGSATDGPVTSTLTPDGKLIPASTAATTAVKGLVTGVTGSLNEVTTKVTPPESPVDSTVEDLTDTVDDVTEGLVP
ncbi:MAG: DUF5667 domain-containing protein [Marmoricola sp.]